MIKIRKNVFETNSSSTHSMVMCSKEDYNLLQNNEAFIMEHGEVIKKEDLINVFVNKVPYRKNRWKEYCKENNLDSTDYNVLADNIINGYDPEQDYDLDGFEENEFISCFDRYDICTVSQFLDSEYLEEFYSSYKTKSGEEVVAFGLYGQEY